MKREDFSDQMNSLLSQKVDGVSWDEKIIMVNEELIAVDQSHQEHDSSYSYEDRGKRNIVYRLSEFAEFIIVSYQFIVHIVKQDDETIEELKALVKEDMEQRRKNKTYQDALKILFPKGHRSLFKEYEKYMGYSRFSSKMESANRLIIKFYSLQKRNVFKIFDAFVHEFQEDLEIAIIKKAQHAKQKQIENDLQIIPNEFDLHALYLEHVTQNADS